MGDEITIKRTEALMPYLPAQGEAWEVEDLRAFLSVRPAGVSGRHDHRSRAGGC